MTMPPTDPSPTRGLQSVRREEGHVTTPDGLRLYWQAWRPEPARACLAIVHGLAEHSGRYERTAEHFAARGYACYAVDCRGHGKSPGLRVHVSSFEAFRTDVRTLHNLVRDRQPSLPVALFGHSQGGLAVLDYVLHKPEPLAGIVLSSPMLGVHPSSKPSAPLRRAAGVLSAVIPSFRLPSGLKTEYLSRDATVVGAYRSDPLVSRRVSARWFTSAMAAMDEVHAHARDLPVPALILFAGADRLTDPEATQAFADAAPYNLTEAVRWEGLYHEILNEPERGAVLARMEAWLCGHVG